MAESNTLCAHPHEQPHRTFWQAQRRYDRFRAAARAIQAATKIRDAELARRVHANIGAYAPSAKTIGRYLGHGSGRRPNPQHFVPITTLAKIVAELTLEREDDLSSLPNDVQTVQQLASEAAKELRRFAVGAAFEGLPARRAIPRRERLRFDKLRLMLKAVPPARTTDDPKHPEFPLNAPRYPATPSLELEEEGYTLIIKDESRNPTGSHKDRWALEKFLQYRAIVEERVEAHDERGEPVELPAMSMISSGGAAFALQSLLRLYGLPPLRVVMDRGRTDDATVTKLRSIGALVRLHDLDADFLTAMDVLALTRNPQGIEITTRDIATPHHECFYDWLICEILLLRPTYIFLPLGTGDLYANLLEVLRAANSEKRPLDRRLRGLEQSDLEGIHVLGATTDNPRSIMDKLYARYPPTRKEIEEKTAQLVTSGCIGSRSGIHIVEDDPFALDAEGELPLSREFPVRAESSGIAGLALFRKLRPNLILSQEDRIVVVNTGLLHVAA